MKGHFSIQKLKVSGNNGFKGTMFTGVQLRALIFPLIMEQILEVSVGMVDTIMISYAGEAAMSGVSLVDMINTLLISIFVAIATGGAVVVSQYLGRKDQKMACLAASQLITIITIIACGIMGLFLWLRAPLLHLLYGSIEQDVMASAMAYFLFSAFSYPFLAMYNAGASIFRSMENAQISMKVSIFMNIFNAIGNAILIFKYHMGASGAAISTLAARMLGAIIIIYLLRKPGMPILIKIRELFYWNGRMVHRILNIGIPNGIENGLFQLGRVLVVSIIALFGTEQIAANAVANNWDAMGTLAGGAMNLAMITVVGQCMGAGKKQEAIYYATKLWKMTYIITAAINVCILALLPYILHVYTLSATAYHYAFVLICIHDFCAILMWPTSFTLSYALRAAGDVKFAMILAIFSMFAFRILFSVILGIYFGLGAIGVWIAMVMDWTFRASFFLWRFRSGKWQKFNVIN